VSELDHIILDSIYTTLLDDPSFFSNLTKLSSTGCSI
jgi:hypothetical protein